jgi:hypothetical protein
MARESIAGGALAPALEDQAHLVAHHTGKEAKGS